MADGVCSGVTCGGHGVCQDQAGSAICVCDEGFTGTSCSTRGGNFYARSLLVSGMADPDVYKEHDDLFFLTGTGNGASVPIYETNDLSSFRLKLSYSPSAADPVYDYCMIWAPDLNKANGVYTLNFSAQRVPNGAACPASGQDVTTFTATAPDLNLRFGVPQPINPNTTYPRTQVPASCVAEGCNRTIRIDSATYNDPSGRWFFYVWFDRGNNISSFNTSAPGVVYNHAGPALYSLPAEEETINEAPEIFKRNGLYYLLLSTGWFNSQYSMRYIVGDSLPSSPGRAPCAGSPCRCATPPGRSSRPTATTPWSIGGASTSTSSTSVPSSPRGPSPRAAPTSSARPSRRMAPWPRSTRSTSGGRAWPGTATRSISCCAMGRWSAPAST
ncbi:family 43 glycosylhydrolase [Cystobacter fuscus]